MGSLFVTVVCGIHLHTPAPLCGSVAESVWDGATCIALASWRHPKHLRVTCAAGCPLSTVCRYAAPAGKGTHGQWIWQGHFWGVCSVAK